MFPTKECEQARSFRHHEGRHVYKTYDAPLFTLLKSVFLAKTKGSSSGGHTAIGVTDQHQVYALIFDQRHTLLPYSLRVLFASSRLGVLRIAARICSYHGFIARVLELGGKTFIDGGRVPCTRDDDKSQSRVCCRHSSRKVGNCLTYVTTQGNQTSEDQNA